MEMSVGLYILIKYQYRYARTFRFLYFDCALPTLSLCAIPYVHILTHLYICITSVCMHVGVYGVVASRHRSAVRGVRHPHYSHTKMLANRAVYIIMLNDTRDPPINLNTTIQETFTNEN